VELRRLIPFDASVSNWAIEASLLRWLTFLLLVCGVGAVLGVLSVGETNFGMAMYVKRQLAWIMLCLVGFNVVVHSLCILS